MTGGVTWKDTAKGMNMAIAEWNAENPGSSFGYHYAQDGGEDSIPVLVEGSPS